MINDFFKLNDDRYKKIKEPKEPDVLSRFNSENVENVENVENAESTNSDVIELPLDEELNGNENNRNYIEDCSLYGWSITPMSVTSPLLDISDKNKYVSQKDLEKLRWEEEVKELKKSHKKWGLRNRTDYVLRGGNYGLSSVMGGANQVRSPAVLQFYDKEDMISIKGKLGDEVNSLVFSFKSGDIRLYKYKCKLSRYKGDKECTVERTPIRGMKFHKLCSLEIYLFNKINNHIRDSINNEHLKNLKGICYNDYRMDHEGKIIKDLQEKTKIKNISEIPGLEKFHNNLLDLLIEKSKLKGIIDDRDEKNLRLSLDVIDGLDEDDRHSLGYSVGLTLDLGVDTKNSIKLKFLLNHLRYKCYLELNNLLYSKDDRLNYIKDVMLHGFNAGLFVYGYEPSTHFNYHRYVLRLLREERDADKICRKLYGYECKGSLRKEFYKCIREFKISRLSLCYYFAKILKRDWLINCLRNVHPNLYFNSSYMKLYRFLSLISDKESSCKEIYKYLVDDSTNSMLEPTFLNDTINLYNLVVLDSEEIRELKSLSVRRMHDYLVNKLNINGHNRVDMGTTKAAPIKEDSYRYDYEVKYFKDLNFLSGELVGNYKIKFPLKAGDLREAGKELSNCLGSYVNRHLVNTFILFLVDTLEDGSEKIKYAVEIKHDAGYGSGEEGMFYVNQYYGYKNRIPEEEDYFSFKDFIIDKLHTINNNESSKIEVKESEWT